jgi:hypothetical protein
MNTEIESIQRQRLIGSSRYLDYLDNSAEENRLNKRERRLKSYANPLTLTQTEKFKGGCEKCGCKSEGGCKSKDGSMKYERVYKKQYPHVSKEGRYNMELQ